MILISQASLVMPTLKSDINMCLFLGGCRVCSLCSGKHRLHNVTNPATLLFTLDSNCNSSYLSKHKEFTTERAENALWSEVMAKKTHEKTLNITDYQRNANQNYNKVFTTHTNQNGHHQKVYKYWRGCGKNKTLLYCWWERKLVQPLWRTIWRFLKKLKNGTIIWSRNPTPGHISGEKHNLKGYTHLNVHCITVYNSQDL